jgi:disulfide bond formation protein DsbB
VTARNLALLAALGSAALLLGALAFQYIGGLAPCKLCIWQRWPHGIAIVLGVIALFGLVRPAAIAGTLTMLIGSGLGVYHAGVEQKWWEGPNTCTSGPVQGLSPEELLNQIMAAPIVRCDEIAWSLMGISMAGWNAIISLGLAAIWLMAAQRAKNL